MLRIHGIARSRAFRCIWAAEEAGLAYEVVPVGFGPGLKAAMAAINPNGKIPALEDGGLLLFESLAINLHIAGKAGAPLMPVGDDAARTLQWTLWAATEAEPAAMQWAYNTYIRAPELRDAAQGAAGAEALAARLAVLEAHLAAGGPWLLGQDFTIADCNLAGVLYGAWANGFDLAPCPTVKAWLDAALSRPAALAARRQREG
ncbi:glutathione S-transferase family protein [Falsiroseomonas selenitidurans]|uniref:Glutathione S-transferase family protein n=1 Tax=Falsiroseomonas selenitidurans TaxID=2716335 RepID=A0ABX1EHA9_9PROT|nr:glutathione S-transferase family protein [Falsiroseomonas selenitidurans]NKC34240.1 glutathione S-transferase family protein [Falsiroseomonas selenitidurans]